MMVTNSVCGRNASGKRGNRAYLRTSALALLVAATPVPALSAPMPADIPAQSIVRATPALWEIRDADTTIYLFGTFHTLDDRTVWFDHRVRQAFDTSGELVLETVVPSSKQEISAAAQEQVSDAPAGPGHGTKLKPFIAQTQAAVSEGRTIGLSVENGADAVLRRVAEDVGKPVGGLELFEDQLRALSRIPSPSPAATQAESPAAAAATLNGLLAAWTSGDTRAFSMMLAGFEANSPVAYRMLISDRNARWGQWIANRLDQPGTVFVAVGSGHLAGKDSVQHWLAARGIDAVRVS